MDANATEGDRQALPSGQKSGAGGSTTGLPQAATASANTRGHANKNTLLFYLKSLGGLSFLIFLSLVILQMGFRTLQRKPRPLDTAYHSLTYAISLMQLSG